jgi:hypothetical protein
MQPVLALARQMLLGRDRSNIESSLNAAADSIGRERISDETYLTSEAVRASAARPATTREAWEVVLRSLDGTLGVRASKEKEASVWRLAGDRLVKGRVSANVSVLEREATVEPLNPMSETVRRVVQCLRRTGEHLPVVIGSYGSGAFRCSVALWVEPKGREELQTFDRLTQLLETWDGFYPNPNEWIAAERTARARAKQIVEAMTSEAETRERAALERQAEAAQLRLQRELGRFLSCLGFGTDDLNGGLYQELSRDIATSERLRRVLEQLGGYPDWDSELREELDAFVRQISENQRKARLLGSEIDAALADPRWKAKALA